MSDDDDLFADSDDEDTDDLIAASKKDEKPIAKPKRLQKKGSSKKRKRETSIPDADKDSDDEPGLFDSDDDNESPNPQKPLSKRERMEALRAKKRQEAGIKDPAAKSKKKADKSSGEKGDGYESENSVDSAEIQRTEEDYAFIDTEGDDQDAINELYAEQTFSDAEAEEDAAPKKKVKGAGSSRGRSERQELEAIADEDNPFMQTVNKMKKAKKTVKKPSELVEEAKEFLAKMRRAVEEDEEAFTQKRPALKKLTMLAEVCDFLARRDMTRVLLDLDVLSLCRRWIQPLPNGKLGNVTVRQRIVQTVSLMNGEQGIRPFDLKQSEFGKVVMSLYMHRDETPAMKRQLKALIEQWSRPIFQKSGNMRDLEQVQHARGGTGLSAISRMQHMEQAKQQGSSVARGHRGGKDQDLNSLIKSGAKGKTESGINRVRIPFSKGFQYTVRPTDRVPTDADSKRRATGQVKESRGNLSKRMLEKSRAVSKNQRSANVSIEGRQPKS